MTMTAEQCRARVIAYEECADHLEQDWTDDPIEREQGIKVSATLRRMANQWTTRAMLLEAEIQGSPVSGDTVM